MAVERRVVPVASKFVRDEIDRIASDPRTRRKLKMTDIRLERFWAVFDNIVELIPDPPSSKLFPRDPDDAPYVDLAIASGALLVVSRDNDLLDLMRDDDPVGVELRRLHPTFRILTPPQFIELADVDA